MKVLSMGFPKSVFPFRSVSQRLNLEYDEVDEIMDQLFREIFEEALEKQATDLADAEEKKKTA